MGLTRPRAAQIFDIDYKQSVRVITTANVTLTGGAPTVVDGVTLSLNNRILVAGQSTGSQNGIYIVSVLGTGSNGTWIRSTDTNATGELESGTIVMVTEGSTYADTSWKLTTNDPIVIGTTALTFEINTGNAFGTISANGTSVIANSATGTVTFSTGNNIVITGNAATDTVTFAVRDNPTFWGNVSPGANITYDLGNTTNRWRDIWLANSTIYLGNAQISANATSVIITNPAGGTTVLSGASPSVNANTVVATGNITGGNLITSGVLSVTGNANVGNLGATNGVFTGSLTGVTTISASGNANVGNLGATNANLTAITATGNANVGNLGTAGLIVATGNANVGNLGTAGLITATGNIAGGNLTTSGQVTASGNITGNFLLANITFASGYNTTKVFNGTSEANIGTSGGNANISIGGVSNVAVFSTVGANITGTLGVTGNITGGNLSGSLVTGTLTTAAQPNITSVGTLTSVSVTGNVSGGNLVTTGTVSTGTLTTSGNATVAGNLTVSGNVISVNVTNLNVVDPIIGIGRGANDTPLTTNDGKDRGEQLWYYTTAEQSAFIGYDNSAGKLIAATNVSISNEVVTVNNYGNLIVGGLESTTISATGNANVGNLGTAGQVTATGNVTGGNLNTAGNITGNYLLANITFASGYNTTKVFNGTSEANIGTPGGNLAITINNTPNVAVFSTSGGNVTGNLYATGNVFGGNILGNGRNLSGIETFRSFAVAGGNTIVADSIIDTFTFSAGSGITLVADPTTDTLTIAAAGEGSDIFVDGADFGTVAEVVTTTDDLGLVTDAITSQADLGEIVISGVFYPTQLVIPTYTVSTLPSATIPAQMIYVSNATGGAITAFSDGTNWRRTSDRSIIN